MALKKFAVLMLALLAFPGLATGQLEWDEDLAPIVTGTGYQEEIHGSEAPLSIVDVPAHAAPGQVLHDAAGSPLDDIQCAVDCGSCGSCLAKKGFGQFHCNGHCCSASGYNDCVSRCLPGNLYASFFGGYVNLQDYRGAVVNPPPPTPGRTFFDPQRISFSNGHSLGFAVGQRVRPRVRREFEFAWRNNAADFVELQVTQNGNQSLQQQPLDGQVNYFFRAIQLLPGTYCRLVVRAAIFMLAEELDSDLSMSTSSATTGWRPTPISPCLLTS